MDARLPDTEVKAEVNLPQSSHFHASHFPQRILEHQAGVVCKSLLFFF